MTAIIDIDAHFEPGDDWLEPYPQLAKRLPKLYARRKQLSARVSQPMYESVSTFATQRGMSICEYVARLINDHIQDQLTHARASRPIH